MKPWKLLTPERLDFAVKYRFFLHLLRGGDQDSERVYRWHIYMRTGGIEGEKSSVDDYVDACHVLLSSVQKNGFLSEYPALLDPNGRLYDGAHRVSLALAMRRPLYVAREGEIAKRTWGFDWFSDQGMSRGDLLRVVDDWCRLRESA